MILHLQRNYLIIIIIIPLLIACSSTSVHKRYNNKPKVKEEKVDNSVRFSSSNDPEFDEEPVEEIQVDQKKFVNEHKISKDKNVSLSDREKILSEVVKYINTPYQYGGANQKGIDCSAFTQNVFMNSIDFSLPRTASEQFNFGSEINSRSNLIFGDLVFFNTTKNSFPGHVGIYLGDELFAHSSSSRGVTISSMSNQYFQQRYVGGRRPLKISY
ncbi:MAG: C40 family peptidase [Bacteroidota bacterium]